MKRSNVATRAYVLAMAIVVTCAGLATAGQAPAPRPAAPAQQPTTPPAGAQMPNMPGMPANVPMGIVTGVVTKAGGGVLAGATVSVTNTTNGVKYSASTDDTGRYALPSLPVASYDVAVTLGGFKPFRRPALAVAANSTQTVDAALETGDADSERLALLDRIEELEKRLGDLESSAVLSEPETRVKRVEVYVDKNGIEYDTPQPGATKTYTYQRERVYRRQTIGEKIEEAMADAADKSVRIGVDATTVAQFAGQTHTNDALVDSAAYALASADLFFTAKLAQYTTFFADVVALSGAPPDGEIPSLTLLNGYTARLTNPNQLNLREVWLRTEFFGQRLALTAGRLDLTNYFDRNAGANDETTQFISDALVNNQMLGLASNGTGAIVDYDPKNAFSFRFGVQQSNDNATNLSDSIYTLSEVGYTATPFSLPEGHYRLWYRFNNGDINIGEVPSNHAVGVSIDQKLSDKITLFGRFGTQKVPGDVSDDYDRQWSGGVSFSKGLVFNPLDTWAVGHSFMELSRGDKEHLTEFYYNFQLTERLRLSLMLQHVLDTPSSESKFGYLLPGVRLQAAF